MKGARITYYSDSEDDTLSLGRNLGSLLVSGDMVALAGELGSGKTRCIKGLALGLGIPRKTVITSPSFSLVNEYQGRCTLFHMDAYRLNHLSEFLSAGLEEYFYQDGVVAMEWADRWPEILPARRIMVHLTITGETTRSIELSAHHRRAAEILEELGPLINTKQE